jgi:2-amino-4-hydroxy-6-hydroxymethyldihydropteridine diphosphokinase
VARIYLGVGSNLEPRKNLKLALLELQHRFGESAASCIYKNAPVGFVGADFMNLVVQIESEVSAQDICKEIELIHNLSGRQRGSNKWGSRPLDIDLLLYNDLILDEKSVRVPREDILKYSFVLRPMAELAPALIHPVTGKSMLAHWQAFDAASHPLERVDVE